MSELDEHKFVLYEADDNDVIANVLIKDETLWTTQKEMARLFDVGIPAISKHLNNIFDEEELDRTSTVFKMEIVQKEGNREVSRLLEFYNLDAIIAVGYRVNSKKATKFSQWAPRVLKEFMTKGFALDDNRLKQGENLLGVDYFRELLERVRSIRASERRIWLQITDIFAEVSMDYDKNSPTTKKFYANVQNKFHFAITGKTAAEIIYNNANLNTENMGLITWKNAPDGRVLKSDTTIAKNYLTENEIKKLERNVAGFFDYIEDIIDRRESFTMEQFSDSIDRFLAFREYEILDGYGSISSTMAKDKAHEIYDDFNKTQKIGSDFEKQINQLLKYE